MDSARSRRAWTIAGAVCLALTVGVLAKRRASRVPQSFGLEEDLRDAVADPLAARLPVAPAALSGARPSAPAPSGFQLPSERRAEAEALLDASAERLERRAALAGQ